MSFLLSKTTDRGSQLRRQAHIRVSTASATRYSLPPKPTAAVKNTLCSYCGGIQPSIVDPECSKYIWCGHCGQVVSENPSTASTASKFNIPRVSRPLPPPLLINPNELEGEIDKTMADYHRMTEAPTYRPKSETNPRNGNWSAEIEEYDQIVNRFESIRFWNYVRASLRDEDED